MAFPKAKKKAIEQALSIFDAELRGTPEWKDWESSPAHAFAINVQDKRYPAKKIVSLATSLSTREFTRDNSVNGFLRLAEFDLVDIRHLPQIDFVKNEIYDRQTEINGPFGGNWQKGIAASKQTSAIFVFSGESGEQYGYFDKEDNGYYSYTGEGKNGPMSMTDGNKAILEHAATGRAIYLFKTLGKGKGQQYIGEYACDSYSMAIGPGEDKQLRDIIIFKLIPVSALLEIEKTPGQDNIAGEVEVSLETMRKNALQAAACAPERNSKVATRTIFDRSKAVKDYVRARAQGSCESCKKPAPFKTEFGAPYLEPHHINRLSDGGLDDPRYVGAICPNCHKEIHYGAAGKHRNELLRREIWEKELQAELPD